MLFRLAAVLTLAAVGAQPCSISPERRLWSKSAGAESKLFAFERNGKTGFIDASGKVVIKPRIPARIEAVGDFVVGRARVDGMGYIDETGKLVIHLPDALWFHDFSEGLAHVVVRDESRQWSQKYQYIDPAGLVAFENPGYRSEPFTEGLAAYEDYGKPGIRSFEPGNIIYRDYPGLKGFLDQAGDVAIGAKFADVGAFRNGLARAVQDGYCYVASPTGSQHGSPTAGMPGSCGGHPADADTPCPTGFIGKTGEFIIKPQFESARDFSEGFAAVRIEGKWGFIDESGEIVIEPTFDAAQSFREGLAPVKVGDAWGYTDTNGQLVIPPRFSWAERFSDSLAIAMDGETRFYIDRYGRVAIAGPFLEITRFVHGIAAVRYTEKRVAYIDKTGKVVFEYFRQ